MKDTATLWRTNYIAPDGGGKLETYDEREPFVEGAPRITRNENSQLFLVMGHIALDKLELLEEIDLDTFVRHIEDSKCEDGLYLRRHKDFGIRQSHDNILAIAVGSVIHNTKHALWICEYGERHGWCFSFNGRWEIESCLQGGDIAVIKCLAGKVPTIWEMIWFIGGMLTPKDAGKINLLTVRLYGLNLVETGSLVVSIFKAAASLVFSLRFGSKIVSSVEEYFRRDSERNPFIDLWKAAFK
jgi:hypothetical protein